MLILVGMLFAVSASKAVEDPALAQIRSLLEPMRARPINAPSVRDATPALTDVKHRLRTWIEGRLHEFHDQDEARAFAKQLNVELRSARLCKRDCSDRGEPGYLGEIELHFDEVLIVTTAVGIECGFDESAYGYTFSNGHWTSFWQSETNDYVAGRYVPLNFLGTLLSWRDYLDKRADPNVRLFMAVARDPAWCESNWYNVYYRVWRLRIDRPEQELLLDRAEEAFFADEVEASLSPRDALIEFSTHPGFTDFQVRRVVRHYSMRGGRLERVDPLALSPKDFADEWMRTEWAVSSHWSSPGANPALLQNMHAEENFKGGEYGNTLYCEARPEYWQVGLVWWDFDGKAMVETKHLFFLVRWLPPYRFSMAGIADRPWSGCTEVDRPADEERTLFPVHTLRDW